MNHRLKHGILWTTVVMVAAVAYGETGREAVQSSGVRGGLVVHVGCGDGQLTAQLHVDDSYLVHGLDTSADNVRKARAHVQSLGLYGKVTANTYDGAHLPYVDNLVNLVVAEDLGQVAMEEVMRVLSPLGVAVINGQQTVKPWPDNIDEWTHALHGPDNNAVARDTVAGEPRHIQWMAGPLWARHHDVTQSLSDFVTASGRIFTIEDRAPIGFDHDAPDEWYIVSRDAFNGIELWKVPISNTDWGWRGWGGHSSGYAARYYHPKLTGRLVAVGNRVYATPGLTAPVSAYDAATGDLIRTYETTACAEELLVQDGLMLVAVKANAPVYEKDRASNSRKLVMAVDVETGEEKWEAGPFAGLQISPGRQDWAHIHLSAGSTKALFVDNEDLVALDITSGQEAWRYKRQILKEQSRAKRGYLILVNYPRIVASDEVVLLAEQRYTESGQRAGQTQAWLKLTALDSADGRELWSYDGAHMSYYESAEVFVVDGLAWVVGQEVKHLLGLDLRTGKEKRRRDVADAYQNGHHHRCYVNRATEKYLTTNRRGMEFLPWDSDETTHFHWLRGGCRVGTFPCNGLVYGLPHPCDCYISSKLNGYVALAATRGDERDGPDADRLMRGPAFARTRRSTDSTTAFDWPTYRHDSSRSSFVNMPMSPLLSQEWKVSLPDTGRLTAPVSVGGTLYVGSSGTHQIYALDVEDGSVKWQSQLGGPIDSPPTVAGEYVLCGGRSGWVYCFHADDGELVWRFQAAPTTRLIMDQQVLESAWPIHGSVLVQGDHAIVTAGRSSYLDGGIYVFHLAVATGEVLEQKVILDEFGTKPGSGRGQDFAKDSGLLSDILVSDQQRVFMRQRCIFGKPDAAPSRRKQPASPKHLTTWGGFLDSSWFNRIFWTLDGIGYGQLVVHNDNVAFAVRAYDSGGTRERFMPGMERHTLSAVNRNDKEVLKQSAISPRTKYPTKTIWNTKVPIRVTTMALTRDVLFVAGTPDKIGSDAPEAFAHYRGQHGGILMAFDSLSGDKRADIELASPPVWDGMAAANGKLFVSCQDGSVVCFDE